MKKMSKWHEGILFQALPPKIQTFLKLILYIVETSALQDGMLLKQWHSLFYFFLFPFFLLFGYYEYLKISRYEEQI